MSKTIDERIVEMRFDNAQFERNISTSMGTLEKLKKSLELKGAIKGLDDVSRRASKGISMDRIADSIQAVEKRFSTMGIVGMEVIRRLTNVALDFAGNAMRKVGDSIISGGIRRAQNIENAHFQLQGLIKDEKEVQAVMADAMDSVDGTAYAYDEAAKAASMFAATGMRSGEQMQRSLKAITGVAAVTNSAYSDISFIFTQIAGKGRIMGEDLNQFANRGLNAAATLAKYYREVKGEVDMTEQGIRDLISGKDTNVYFEEFAEAMAWAFGDQAKKANETFNGAMSNIKAALARIGAKFVSPLLVQNGEFVKLFNVIRERVNDINRQMDPFASKFTANMKSMARSLTSFLDNFDAQHRIAETMPKLYRIFANSVNVLSNVLKAFGSAIKPAIQGLQRFIPFDVLDRIGDFTAKLVQVTKGLKVSDETAGKIRKTFQGVSAVFHILGNAVKAFVSVFGDDFVNGLKAGLNALLNLGSGFGEWILGVDKSIQENGFFVTVLTNLRNIFIDIKDVISAPIEKLKEFSKTGNIFKVIKEAVDKAKDSLKSFFATLSKDSESAGDEGGFTNIKSVLKSILTAPITILQNIDQLFGKIGTVIGKVASSIGGFLKKIGDGFTKAFTSEGFTALKEAVKTGMMASIIASLASFTKTFKNLSTAFSASGLFGKSGIFASTGDITSQIRSVLLQVTNNLEAMQKKIKAEMVKEIAKALAILAASLFVISMIDSNKLGQSLGAISVILIELAGVMLIVSRQLSGSRISTIGAGLRDGLSGLLDSFSNTIAAEGRARAMATTMLSFAGAIVILSLALAKIATIDSNRLWDSVKAISWLIGELTASTFILTKFGGDATIASGGLIAFAAAIRILTSSLAKIAEIDPNRLWESVGALTALVGMLDVSYLLFTNLSNISGKGGAINVAGIIGFAAAIGVLTIALNKISEIDPNRLWESVGALASLVGMLTAASVLIKIGGDAKTSALGLIAMAGAVYILSMVVEKFSEMDYQKTMKGIEALMDVMIIFVASMVIMSKAANHSVSSAAALLILSGALVVVSGVLEKFGSMDWTSITKGLVAMGVALTEMVAALAILGHFGGGAGSAAAILVMSVAITVLTGCLKALGAMSWEAIIKGLVAIGGALTVIGVAATLLAPVVPAILALSGALLALGAACALAGAGLTLIATGLATLAVSGVAGAAALVEIAKTLIVGWAEAIVTNADAITTAVVTLIQIAVDAINDTKQLLIDSFLKFVLDVLVSLNDYLPQIVGVAMDLIGNLIREIGSRLPQIDIGAAIAGFINKVIQTVKDVFSQIDFGSPEEILQMVGIFAIVTALMYAMAGLAALAPGAMLGVLAAGAVIAEMSIVLAAIGALNKIPGLQEFVESGGNLLQAVGTAIGQFVGGLVGGFAEGVTSALPQIATDLSNFMANIQPFINSASKIDASLLEGVGYLAGAIIAITAAELINGIANFLSGGTLSLKDFGDQIAELGPGIAAFGESVKDIDPTAVEASASAAKMIAELVNTLPREGGVLEKIFGQAQSLGQFAADLVPFGTSMKLYSIAVQGVTPEAVEGSVRAAQMIADMAKTLPNSGGLAAKIFGDNKLSDFAKELVPFGVAIKVYCGHVQGVTPEAVEGSVKAAQILADMAKTLPNSGGLSALIFGDNKLSDFANELVPFAQGMKKYSDAIAGIDNEAVTASANAALALSELANGLPNEGGIISWFTGDNTIDKFGENLKGLGAGIAAYSEAISGKVDLVTMNSVMTELKKLADFGKTLSSMDVSVYSGFAQSLKTMGENGITALVGVFEGSTGRVTQAVTGMIGMVTGGISANMSTLTASGTNAGETVVNGIINGIINTTAKLMSTITTLCSNVVKKFQEGLHQKIFRDIGANYIIYGIIHGMNMKKQELFSTIRTICSSVIETFKSGLPTETFVNIGRSVIEGIISGLKDEGKINEMKEATLSLIDKIKETLEGANTEFENIGKNIDDGIAKGIRDNGEAVAKALKEIIDKAIAKEKKRLGIESPSKVMAEDGKYMSLGLAKGISDYADRVVNATEEVSDSALDSMRNAIRRIANLVDSEMDIQPTIAPVVDLTNVQNGAKQMRGILTRGISTSFSYNKALNASTTNVPDALRNSTDRTSTVSNSYNFTQNNYSPKALSRKEIYRQTRNQFSALKGAVSGI